MAITTKTADLLMAKGVELGSIAEALYEAGHKNLGGELSKTAANVASAGMRLRGEIEMADWQPIKTAPRDGTRVLIGGGAFFDSSETFPRWRVLEETSIAAYVGVGHRADNRTAWWRGENSGYHDEFYWYAPTHWQRLPATPDVIHASDCALHNAPAMRTGPCDCGVVAQSQG